MVHVGAGVVATIAGLAAVAVTKGGAAHRKTGLVFVYAMLTMALVGATIAAYEGKVGSVDAGLLTAYLVTTALLTVRPETERTRRVGLAATLIAVSVGVANITAGTQTLRAGAMTRDGNPVAVCFIFAGIALLAAYGDARVMQFGPRTGKPRLARHLWRMCFALFVASASFFLGQAQIIPKVLRVQPVLLTLAFAPLAIMGYWLWRVRSRSRLRGVVLAAER